MSTLVTQDGTEIYFKEGGAGKPVLYSHGWPLDGRPNITLTLLLLVCATWRTVTAGRSPAILFGGGANTAVVSTLHSRRSRAVEGVFANGGERERKGG